MADEIRKYELPYEGGDVVMPYAARLLSVGERKDTLVVWAAVETTYPLYRRRFVVARTGEERPLGCVFLGTVQCVGLSTGSRVVHVFDGGERGARVQPWDDGTQAPPREIDDDG